MTAFFTLVYESSEGVRSTRKIKINSVVKNDKGFLILNAVDLNVSRVKSFKVDNIISLHDEWENPVVNKKEFFGSLLKKHIHIVPDMSVELDKSYYDINGFFQIEFKSSSGEVTIRNIRADRLVESSKGSYVVGYCFKTSKARSFNVERIINIVDTKTGEIHTDAKTFLVRFKIAA